VFGFGTLSRWNPTTESWDAVVTGQAFNATIADGGSSTVCSPGAKKGSCTAVSRPDFFRMYLPDVDVPGETAALVQLRGGNVVVR
jgi:hypothetical protein